MPTTSLPEDLIAGGSRSAAAWSLLTALTVAVEVGELVLDVFFAHPVKASEPVTASPAKTTMDRRILTSLFDTHSRAWLAATLSPALNPAGRTRSDETQP